MHNKFNAHKAVPLVAVAAVSLLFTSHVASNSGNVLPMDELRDKIDKSTANNAIQLGILDDLPEQAGESLRATPPVWKNVSLTNNGKGWQSWSGKTKMILLNGELYPAATTQKYIGSNCTVYIRANKVYGCFYQKAAVNKTSWKSLGGCSFWNRGSAGWSAPQFRGSALTCDPLVKLIGKNGQYYATTKTNSTHKAVLAKRDTIGQNAYVFMFDVFKKVTQKTPGQVVDGRVKSLAVLVEK